MAAARALAFAAALAAAPALAETPMSAEAFEAYVTGKTLVYGTTSGPYGIEDYMPDRRVRWSFLDGECVEGVWYPQGEAICFAYENREEPQCWYFYDEPAGLRARPVEAPEGASLYEISRSPEPMQCKGPRIGV